MLKIQELRNAANLTQKELAEKIGVKNYTIANWEQGRTEPSLQDLIDLANYFACSVDYLLGRENDFGQIVIATPEEREQTEFFGLYNALSEERKNLVRTLLQDLTALTDKERKE